MLDLTKKLQTRDGREVRIYATDGGGQYPIHGAVLEDGVWEPETWTIDGVHCVGMQCKLACDLINVPVKHTRTIFVNVYPNLQGMPGVVHESRERADRDASSDRIACVPVTIEFTEGEGLA